MDKKYPRFEQNGQILSTFQDVREICFVNINSSQTRKKTLAKAFCLCKFLALYGTRKNSHCQKT